jgi:hypothetical protein
MTSNKNQEQKAVKILKIVTKIFPKKSREVKLKQINQ